MTDLVLVNPNNRIPTQFSAIEPPLWAGLIASFLNVDIIDAEAMNWTLERTVATVRSTKCNKVIIVVMGNNPSVSSTPKMPIAKALAERIKDLDVYLTGIHPIAVKGKYKVITKLFEGCPDIPFDKLPMDKYRAHNWHCLDGSPRSPYASVYTSLGCPFNCCYCNIHTLYGNRKVTLRPIESVLREIDLLATKYKVRNIKFWDELFTLDEDRVISICDGLKEYHLNIWAYARLDTVTGKMLKAMKEGGINWLAYGFESISDKKLGDRADYNIRMTRDAGINIIGNFMFGLRGDTALDMRRNLDFAKEQLFEYVNFYVARPYPGSQWFEDTKPNMAWEDYDQYGKNRLPFRDMAFIEYFTNSKYLEMIEAKFGNQGVEHIKAMLKGGPGGAN